MSDLSLDGNALAGVLAEAFGDELTDTPRGCGSCGAVTAIGAHRVYRGAGFVLRCPACGDVAAQIAVLPDRIVLHLSGTWHVEIPNRLEAHDD